MNKPINQPIDELIDICWSKVVERHGSKEFIYVSQTFDLINEMQILISSKNPLFTNNEDQLLRKMTSDNPTLKLYKHELVRFLLRLVHFTSLEKFLSERGGIKSYEINNIVTTNSRPFRKPLSPYNKKYNDIKSPAKPISTSTPMTYSSRPLSKQTVSPPQSPVSLRHRPYDRKEINGLRSSVLMKEQQINDRESQYSIVSQENNQLSMTIKTQERKIVSLESDIKSLKNYVETLEYQIERQSVNTPNSFSDRNLIKELVNKNTENEKVIKHLENICEKNQQELAKTKSTDHKYEPIIRKITYEMNRQDELVEKLKSKLKLNEKQTTNKTLQDFLQNLPFIKQYYFYYKYQQDQKNFGILFINFVTLCLSSVVILNIVKFVFYFVIYVFNANTSSTDDLREYIYDDYGLNTWFGVSQTSFVWWKEIEWLEYLIFNISDWINS